MPRYFHLTAVSIILILSIACLFSCSGNSQADAEAGNGDPDAGEIGRIENPNLDDAELASLVDGNTTFAIVETGTNSILFLGRMLDPS